MPKYFSGTYATTQILSTPTIDNPATVTSTGVIFVSSTIASTVGLFGPSGYPWTVTNLGTVASVGSSGIGIDLAAGGSVTNGATASTGALIEGSGTGVKISGAIGTVTNFGTIEGTGAAGIGVYLTAGGSVTNGASASTTALIEGVVTGVKISGSAGTVTNFGTILGTTGNGVYLTAGGSVTNKGLISGATDVVFVNAAPGTVVNDGTILGTSGPGVWLNAGGRVTNNALISGSGDVVFANYGLGAVYNFGTIENIGTSGSGVYLDAGGTVANSTSETPGALIRGYNHGVEIKSISGTVTNYGTIASIGTGSTGVYLGTGGGSVTNGAGGLILADSNGVTITGTSGTVVNHGTITATATFGASVYLANGGGVTNGASGSAAGSIIGNSNAVAIFFAPGTVTNFGTISAIGSAGYGAVLSDGGRVANFGTILETGTSGAGVRLGAGGSLTNGQSGSAAGLIAGGGDGVDIAGGLGTVANFATIAGTGTHSNGVALFAGGSVTNGQSGATTGLIEGSGRLGVYIGAAAGTVTNFGTIDSAAAGGFTYFGVYLRAGGSVTNQLGGVIAGSAGGVAINTGSGTVVNRGRIESTGTALYPNGVYLGAGGSVANFGTIAATGGSNGIAVNISFGGSVTNAVGALLQGAADAVIISGGPGGVTNYGTIRGGVDGIVLKFAGDTATNFGTIVGTASYGVYLYAGGGATNGVGGRIDGAYAGILATHSAGTVVNFGSIGGTGSNGVGVSLRAGGLLTNAAGGSITGAYSAITLGGTTAVAATVTNSGRVAGSIGISINSADTGNNTIVNFGTITGTGGIAIHLGGGNDQVVIEAGSSLLGAVANFNPGDSFDLPFLPFSSSGTVTLGAGNLLQIVENGGTFTIALDPSQSFSGDIFQLGTDSGSGTLITELLATTPSVPSGLALAPGSDSGVTGDNLTNVVTPVITGIGDAGATITLFDTGTTLGSATVGAGGLWSVTTSLLTTGTHTLSASATFGGSASALSVGLAITIDTTASPPTGLALSPASDSGVIGDGITNITTPSITGTGEVGATVRLFDGATQVGSATVAASGSWSVTTSVLAQGAHTLSATQSDVAGNVSSASAGLTITIERPQPVHLFDFVFTYNDGKDYYDGTVADGGTFGYRAGQTITTAAGRYDIFNDQGLGTTQAAGTVFVTYYSHGGLGQASTMPVSTAAGVADGTLGLGSESDALLGLDGLSHAFSATVEASFATTALFGFVFTYADGSAFYTGTVADDGSFGLTSGNRTVSDSSGNVLGSYSIFSDGVTTRASGTAVVDRFTSGGSSFIPNHATTSSVDGSGGIGSETGSITVNGLTVTFGSRQEPVLKLTVATVPVTPAPSTADVITSELNEIYRQVLGRNPDSSGLATYTAALNGGSSLASIRQIIAHSPEAQSDLNGLYRQIFGRDADTGGLNTYEDFLTNGSSLASVALILGQSPEAQNDLKQIYQDVLARDADGGGLTTYMALLGNGSSLSNVRGIVAHSPEAKNDLIQLFQGVLGRAPGAAELIGMEDQLGVGGTSQQSLNTALTSTGSAGGFTTITAGTGPATLTAQPKTPTLFVFGDIAFGNDTIVGFDATRDTIQLPHARVADLTTLNNETSGFAGGSLITLNPSQSILITGVAPASLGSANFRIV